MRLQRCVEAVGQLYACLVLLTHYHNHYSCCDLSFKVAGVNLIQIKILEIHIMINVADVPAATCVAWLVYTVKQQQQQQALMARFRCAQRQPFTWHWRSTAAAGGRGRCRRL